LPNYYKELKGSVESCEMGSLIFYRESWKTLQ